MQNPNEMYEIGQDIVINKHTYHIEKLLGHGKGGYSFLVTCKGEEFVLKKLHHEPCDYYEFGNKLEAEKNDYKKLTKAKIRVPKLIEIDEPNETLVKEYIPGETALDLVIKGDLPIVYFEQVYEQYRQARISKINIDYFPSNFILFNDKLYYVDYECNPYNPKWNLENWGIRYWLYTKELEDYLKSKELPIDEKRRKDEREINKQIALLTCQYY